MKCISRVNEGSFKHNVHFLSLNALQMVINVHC